MLGRGRSATASLANRSSNLWSRAHSSAVGRAAVVTSLSFAGAGVGSDVSDRPAVDSRLRSDAPSGPVPVMLQHSKREFSICFDLHLHSPSFTSHAILSLRFTLPARGVSPLNWSCIFLF